MLYNEIRRIHLSDEVSYCREMLNLSQQPFSPILPCEVSILDLSGSQDVLLAGISPTGAGDKLMNAKLHWKVNTRAAASRYFN